MGPCQALRCLKNPCRIQTESARFHLAGPAGPDSTGGPPPDKSRCVCLTEYAVCCLPGGIPWPRVFLRSDSNQLGIEYACFARCEIMGATPRAQAQQANA